MSVETRKLFVCDCGCEAYKFHDWYELCDDEEFCYRWGAPDYVYHATCIECGDDVEFCDSYN